MRILIVGADSPYAIEKPYLCYLREIEEVSFVDLFAAQNIFLKYYNRSLLHKAFYRIGISTIIKKINVQLLQVVSNVKPDSVLVFKGMEVDPRTLQILKEKGVKLINYNPDNPFVFSGKGSGNKNVSDSLALYDLHLTYNSEIKLELERQFKIPVKLIPFGYDISKKLFQRCQLEVEVIKTCFLGNPDRNRASFLKELCDSGISIDVYGHNWDRWISHEKITINNAVYGKELWKTLRKYRVQLNLMRIHNLNSHNMRSFEVPGVGGIMVAPYTNEHLAFFEDEKEIFLYTSVSHCVKIINFLLGLTPEAALKVRHNARRRSVESGYSYRDRAKQVFAELQNL